MKMAAIKFEAAPEFRKELISSIKKYRHLEEDFERFKKALEINEPQEMRGTFRISDLGINIKIPIYKVKHFRSLDFKGKGSKSGFRIIYAHMNEEHKIIFIEFYHKNNKTNHDVKRIKKYFGEY
jgi:mRNA-degrading endonuclease RelE of RelBE toxin-antitoxin system